MQTSTKFNESLVQKVREGKLWLECEGDMEKTREVLRHIFPEDETSPSKANLFFIAFHNDATYWKCNDQIIDSNPWTKVSDFFLPAQPEKEGKKRTYRVTREQARMLWYSADDKIKEGYYDWVKKYLGVFSSHMDFTEAEVEEMFNQFALEFIKPLFPDFDPTPHIPKGEFAWVRNTDQEEWLCKMSAGNGEFYHSQKGDGFLIDNWKHVRKYEDRPF